jgi:radical SAM protein with 4Fe4S-binding SPASM domain
MNKIKDIICAWPLIYRYARNIIGLIKGCTAILKGRRGAKDHLKSTISLILRSPVITGRPINITIEPTNVCNLKCPVCETGTGELQRDKRHLSFEDFKTIIDKIVSHTNTIMYYFMGEPFLNKGWVAQVSYAKKKGIPFVTTCTNGDFACPDDILASGIDLVSFQLGGMSQETHQIYRIGSDISRVMSNLEETIKLRNKKGLKKPVIEVGFILMKHNEHEVSTFKDYCGSIGANCFNLIDPCVRTIEQGRRFLPGDRNNWIYDPEAFDNGVLKRRYTPQNDCPWIYYSMTVLSNGDVVPCCHDPRGKFVMGNLLKDDLEAIWNGDKFTSFRAAIVKSQQDIPICRLCSGYGVSKIK